MQIPTDLQTFAVDPGWNDPPMLNFSATQPPPKSRIGNKRVPFPMGPASPAQTSKLSPNIDPPENNTSEEIVPNMMNLTINNLKSVLDPNKYTKVYNKINLIEEMWKKGLFSSSMKQDLYTISDCIIKKDRETADKLSSDFHAKYPDQCKDWIIALDVVINP